jgi:hypothetical protein
MKFPEAQSKDPAQLDLAFEMRPDVFKQQGAFPLSAQAISGSFSWWFDAFWRHSCAWLNRARSFDSGSGEGKG